MLLYSFLGILTLQIGVAVLSDMFIIVAVLASLSNLLDVDADNGLISYILVCLLILLLLIAGVVMFSAAYLENPNICFCSVILVGVILFLFVITSIISFLNIPSMTKNVCVSRHHCPESLWLSSLNYRKNFDTMADEVEMTTQSEYSMTERIQHIEIHRMYHSTRGTYGPESTDEAGFQRKEKHRRKKPPITEHPNDSERSTEPILSVQFPIDSTALRDSLFLDYKNNRVLRIFKRSISLIVNYLKEDRSQNQSNKRDFILDSEHQVDIDNSEHEGTTESPTTPSDEEQVGEGSKYDIGYDFGVAIILFVIIIAFFIFTMIVLWSYRLQLIYTRLYSIDPASKHYLV